MLTISKHGYGGFHIIGDAKMTSLYHSNIFGSYRVRFKDLLYILEKKLLLTLNLHTFLPMHEEYTFLRSRNVILKSKSRHMFMNILVICIYDCTLQLYLMRVQNTLMSSLFIDICSITL